jgi:hypothetical protein
LYFFYSCLLLLPSLTSFPVLRRTTALKSILPIPGIPGIIGGGLNGLLTGSSLGGSSSGSGTGVETKSVSVATVGSGAIGVGASSLASLFLACKECQ